MVPKKPPPPISCFPYFLDQLHRIFKIIVPLIKGGMNKNFGDPIQSDQDIRKTRYGRKRLFRNHPLYLLFNVHWLEFVLESDNFHKVGINYLFINTLKFSRQTFLRMRKHFWDVMSSDLLQKCVSGLKGCFGSQYVRTFWLKTEATGPLNFFLIREHWENMNLRLFVVIFQPFC